LTIEDLIFCPYCDQRMVPPKDFNLCPACGGELPLGATYCLKCGEKLLPEEGAAIEEQVSEILSPAPEEIASPVIEEPPVVQEPEPASTSVVEEIIPPVQEETPAVEQAPEPPAHDYWKEIESQQVNDELPVVEEALPPAEATPVPEPVPPQPIEEGPMVEPRSAQTEEEELPVYESPSALAEEPGSPVMPVQEEIPSPVAEEEMPPDFKQTPAAHVPLTEDILRAVNGPTAASTKQDEVRKDFMARKASGYGEFLFCITCGQKLPPGAFYCAYCGKSTFPENPPAEEEPVQPSAVVEREVVARPEQIEPPVVEAAPMPPPAPPQREIPSETNVEPEPVPLADVQPKYRPVQSREPISSAMEDRAPALKPFPKAGPATGATAKVVWDKINGWLDRAIDAAVIFIKGQQRGFREIYDRLFKEREPSPVDMTSAEALKQASKKVEAPARRPIRVVYLVLGVIFYIALFVLIGVALTRCVQ
jgi:ribosomal protein L40E